MSTFVKPYFPRGEVDRAGQELINEDMTMDPDRLLAVLSNWRAAHGYPLQAIKMTLKKRARKIDPRALVAQRQKRYTSIAIKLLRNPNMKLSQMQDIGGCRAIVGTARNVDDLVAKYEREQVQHVRRQQRAKDGGASCRSRPQLVKKFDYIAEPKDDGYRSVHFVYKYLSDSPEHAAFNNLRIEVQIRSRLQHAWATALETVDTFTKQALKSGAGTEQWRRFFVLMGSAIAMREKRPLVPGAPEDPQALKDELRRHISSFNIRRLLRGWSNATKYLTTDEKLSGGERLFLLVLDMDKKHVDVKGFKHDDQRVASDQYLLEEQRLRDREDGSQVVLVTVDSLRALPKAYPNYFADTNEFLAAMALATE